MASSNAVACAIGVALIELQEGVGDALAVGVLRQARSFAKLGAGEQVRARARQLVAFAQHHCKPGVHVGSAAQNWTALCCRHLKRPLEHIACLSQPAERQADIAQRDRSAEGVGEVTGAQEAVLASGPCSSRLLKLAFRPVGDSQQRSCSRTGEVVVGRRELQHIFGVAYAPRQITPHLSEGGAVELDQPRHARQLGLVNYNNADRRLLTTRYPCRERLLDVAQPVLKSFELAERGEDACKGDPQHGPLPDQSIGEGPHPVAERALLAGLLHGKGRKLNQLCCAFEVLRRQGVADCCATLARCLVPVAGAPAQQPQPVQR